MMTTEEAKRLEAWIMDHERDWETICGRGKYPITGEEFIAYYRELMDHRLECMVLVLLTCHGYAVQDRITARMIQLVQGLRFSMVGKSSLIHMEWKKCLKIIIILQ